MTPQEHSRFTDQVAFVLVMVAVIAFLIGYVAGDIAARKSMTRKSAVRRCYGADDFASSFAARSRKQEIVSRI